MSKVESKTHLGEPLFSLQRISCEGTGLVKRGRTQVAVVARRIGGVEEIEHINKRVVTATIS